MIQEIKLFEIANTLLDVINCVPFMSQDLSLRTQTPRNVLHSLCCLLSSIGGANSHNLIVLQSKVAESKIPFRPIPRVIELRDHRPASPPSNEKNSSVSTAEWEYLGSGSGDSSVAQQSAGISPSQPQWPAVSTWTAPDMFVSTTLLPTSNSVCNAVQIPWEAF